MSVIEIRWRPTVDDVADKINWQQPDTPDAAARQRRRTLRELHSRLRSNEGSTDDLAADVINDLFALADNQRVGPGLARPRALAQEPAA